MILNWHKKRNEFNHDWMKNKYIPALGTWMNLLDDKLDNDEIEKSFIESKLPEWELHRSLAIALLHDFETEMSPRMLFSKPPLFNCDEDTKQWLGELIHCLWLERYSVKGLVKNATERAKNTNAIYEKLCNSLKNCKNIHKIKELKKYRELFSEFLKACRELSEAIEKFPSEVKVL